ncbi:hypothetical protein FMM74_019130 [Lachnospiraceae bacterium MD308]|nr:hypothetical protein [Lachnospiraceae bacterium MD308]
MTDISEKLLKQRKKSGNCKIEMDNLSTREEMRNEKQGRIIRLSGVRFPRNFQRAWLL